MPPIGRVGSVPRRVSASQAGAPASASGPGQAGIPAALRSGIGRALLQITGRRKKVHGHWKTVYDVQHAMRLLALLQGGVLDRSGPLEQYRPRGLWRSTVLAIISRESSGRPADGCGHGRPCGLTNIAPRVVSRDTIRDMMDPGTPASKYLLKPVAYALLKAYRQAGGNAEKLLRTPRGNILAFYARMTIYEGLLKHLLNGHAIKDEAFQALLILLHHEGVSTKLLNLVRAAVRSARGPLTLDHVKRYVVSKLRSSRAREYFHAVWKDVEVLRPYRP